MTGQRVIVGINLEANSPRIAHDEAAAFLTYLGPRTETVAVERGSYTFELPSLTAALLTVPRPS